MKMIAHIVIKIQWCFLLIFLDYECTMKLQRILLQFEVYLTFEASKHSNASKHSDASSQP